MQKLFILLAVVINFIYASSNPAKGSKKNVATSNEDDEGSEPEGAGNSKRASGKDTKDMEDDKDGKSKTSSKSKSKSSASGGSSSNKSSSKSSESTKKSSKNGAGSAAIMCSMGLLLSSLLIAS